MLLQKKGLLILVDELQSNKDEVRNLTNYGLRAGGVAQCPNCGSNEASFIALNDDRFFRPTLGNLRKWKDDKRQRRSEDAARNTAANV